MKQDGRLLADLSRPRQAVEDSRDYLVSRVEPQAGWAVKAVAG
jgi:hypothetical protein